MGSDDVGGKSSHSGCTMLPLGLNYTKKCVMVLVKEIMVSNHKKVKSLVGGRAWVDRYDLPPVPKFGFENFPEQRKAPVLKLMIKRQDGLYTHSNDKSPVLMPLRIWSSDIRTEFKVAASGFRRAS